MTRRETRSRSCQSAGTERKEAGHVNQQAYRGSRGRAHLPGALWTRGDVLRHRLRISEAALDTLGRAGFNPGESVRIIQQLAALFAEPGTKPSPIDESLDSYPRLRDTLHSNLWHDSAHHLELGVDIVMLGIQALLEQTRRERESA
jgi:hypothetical protein